MLPSLLSSLIFGKELLSGIPNGSGSLLLSQLFRRVREGAGLLIFPSAFLSGQGPGAGEWLDKLGVPYPHAHPGSYPTPV